MDLVVESVSEVDDFGLPANFLESGAPDGGQITEDDIRPRGGGGG